MDQEVSDPGTPRRPRGLRWKDIWRSGALWMFLYVALAGIALDFAMQKFDLDWAAGALMASGAMAVLFVVIAATALIRALRRNGGMMHWVSAALIGLALAALGGVSLTQQSWLHTTQAHALEAQGQWQAAIAQYRAGSASHATAADDIARVYCEWGEHLSILHRYEEALSKFEFVLTSYSGLAPEDQRARSDTIAAYHAWADQDLAQQHYQDALDLYSATLSLPYCDTVCQHEIIPLAAGASLKIGEAALDAHNYVEAITALLSFAVHFAAAVHGTSLYTQAATDLRAAGTGALATRSCSLALSSYQELVAQFADTPEGKQSASDLKAPVSVTGHFTSAIPADAIAFLGQDLLAKGQYGALFALLAPGTPRTSVSSNGHFRFGGVAPGNYDLAWGYGKDTYGNPTRVYTVFSFNHAAYQAHAQPLCGYDFGDITIPFVVA